MESTLVQPVEESHSKSMAILCASVVFTLLQSCPGRNHVLFTWTCPRLLRVLFYSRPSRLLNSAVQSSEASQHLSWSWGRSRLELLSWFSAEGPDCSPPVNYCTHWEAPLWQHIWWVGELPKQCSQARPLGHLWGHSLPFHLKSLLWSE